MSNDKDDSFSSMFERVMGEGAGYSSVLDEYPASRRLTHVERAALLDVFDRVMYDKYEAQRKEGHITPKACAKKQTVLMNKAGIPEFVVAEKEKPDVEALLREGLIEDWSERCVTLSPNGRQIPHDVRINMLKGKERENFDEVMDMMREDFRSYLHIQSVQNILLKKAGVPEHHFVKETVQPMEWCGHWIDPLTGASVPNPNVKYNSYPISNIADPLKADLDTFYRQIDEDVSYELSQQVAVDGRSLEVVRVIKQKFMMIHTGEN